MRRRRPIWPGYATVPDAVRYLASACDGAIRRDGHGFSAEHVTIGHWLAHEPDNAWTTHHLSIGRHLVAVYSRQLKLAGFDTGAILRGAPAPHRPGRDYKRLAPRWAPDPTGVWPYRWWNGVRWTCHGRERFLGADSPALFRPASKGSSPPETYGPCRG